jgi:hypothetical protein
MPKMKSSGSVIFSVVSLSSADGEGAQPVVIMAKSTKKIQKNRFIEKPPIPLHYNKAKENCKYSSFLWLISIETRDRIKVGQPIAELVSQSSAMSF